MKKGLGCIIALVVLVVIVGIWGISAYNDLVRTREAVNGAWSQVQNVYQRRMDLIPNLVETVKGVAQFERETYTQLAEARAKAGQIQISPQLLQDPEAFRRFEELQTQLSGALSRLLAVAENYPQLKANENFLMLQNQLEGTENRIAVERRRYNEVVQQYNTKIRSFPMNLIAPMMGFKDVPYFAATPGAERPPAVKFD
ncbi:MAG TPA: LemA family protein [Acidobacteriota bacterium]|nr:LemA family protein [Acidobacteriota bacterium]